MSPEQERSFEGDDQKQKVQAMLGSITDAIAEEDYEFAAQAALGQELVSPADVVEYVHLQSKSEEDPVAQRRIRDGVNSIVASLRKRDQAETAEGKERSLTDDDVERINKVMQDVELQELAESEVLAEEPDVDTDQYAEPNYEWDEDVFSVDLSDYSDEEIEKAEQSLVFKAAMEEGHRTIDGVKRHIKKAREMIEQGGGKYKELQLLIFDGLISMVAETEAQRTIDGRPKHIKQAREIIENLASSPERAQAMLDEFGL